VLHGRLVRPADLKRVSPLIELLGEFAPHSRAKRPRRWRLMDRVKGAVPIRVPESGPGSPECRSDGLAVGGRRGAGAGQGGCTPEIKSIPPFHEQKWGQSTMYCAHYGGPVGQSTVAPKETHPGQRQPGPARPQCRPQRAPALLPNQPTMGPPMVVEPRKATDQKDMTRPRICGELWQLQDAVCPAERS